MGISLFDFFVLIILFIFFPRWFVIVVRLCVFLFIFYRSPFVIVPPPVIDQRMRVLSSLSDYNVILIDNVIAIKRSMPFPKRIYHANNKAINERLSTIMVVT